ncbi:MAG TPA: DnaJ domain-containing protein [Pyrinomonadaceae bacterium]|jgi:curved DNA-binding protein CbpA
MSRFDASKDYYSILGAQQDATPSELERLYKRRATQHHPDRGGDEEEMKALNEAYGVLKDDATRSAYDAERQPPSFDEYTEPYSSPSAVADEISGRSVEALLCLFAGVVLLVLVRAHWIRFLWPLGILAVFVIVAGVLLAHSVMLAIRETYGASHPARRYAGVQETLFWSLVGCGGYGLYVVLVNL